MCRSNRVEVYHNTRSSPETLFGFPCHNKLTDSGESVMRIVGNTGQLTDSVESVMRIVGNTGQLTDWGEPVN